MDVATVHRRLRDARVGRLATADRDGRPHLVPCCFVLTGSAAWPGPEPVGGTIYSAVDAKPKTTRALRRLANLRANPAASLLVDHYEEDWSALWWVRVDGHGRVLDTGQERDRALAQLALKYAQYRKDRPPGPVIALDVTSWRAWP